jgi:predicted metal-dependent HD superfamily phosphohydrolase
VYDTRSQDNEERSAAWAETAALNAGVPAEAALRVRDLILATKHEAAPATAAAKLLVDVDLAILGAPVERFDEYERQVREEYSWVLSWLFRRTRREILLAFLERPHLFSTEYFRANYETQARANLERSIKALGG